MNHTGRMAKTMVRQNLENNDMRRCVIRKFLVHDNSYTTNNWSIYSGWAHVLKTQMQIDEELMCLTITVTNIVNAKQSNSMWSQQNERCRNPKMGNGFHDAEMHNCFIEKIN
jgi:hypothetical protein